ncbi:MAG: AI-2E family transporter [Solirubrobacterales bacterium]
MERQAIASRPTGIELSPKAVARTVITVLAVLGAIYLVYLLRKPIGWLILAAFLAVAMTGPVNLFSRIMPRGLAIGAAYLALILVPLLLGAVIVVPVIDQADDLASNAPGYAADVQRFVSDNGTLQDLERKYGVVSNLQTKARELPDRIGDAASALGSVGSGVVNSGFAIVNILILSVFMVGSGGRWTQRLIAMQPEARAEPLRRALAGMANAVGNYVAGAVVQATIAGLTTFIVLAILGVPFAAPLAVVTALFDLIPLIGATLGAVVVGVVTVFTDFPTATIVWLIWAVVYQQIENNLIQPQIQKRALSVNPFVVIVAVLFGSTLFGILGALLAIPAAASIQVAGTEYLQYRRGVKIDPHANPVPAG